MISDTARTIDDCWKGSVSIFGNGDYPLPSEVAGLPVSISVVVLFLIVLFIFFSRSEFLAVKLSFNALFNNKVMDDIEDNKSYTNAIRTTSVICLPVVAFLLYHVGIVNTSFFNILFCIIGYVIIRIILFYVISWLKRGREKLFPAVACSGIYWIAFTVMALPVLAVSFLFPEISVSYYMYYLLDCFVVLTLLYYVSGFRIIMSAGFSFFFWILYLCTLELLPTGLMISFFISL